MRPRMDPDDAAPEGATADQVGGRLRATARRLASALTRTAQTLEVSADLADRHARERFQAGDEKAAAEERLTARRARDGSQRARRQAARWLERSKGGTG